MNFSTQTEVDNYLTNVLLLDLPFTNEDTVGVVNEIKSCIKVDIPTKRRPGTMGMLVEKYKYVIKDDDVKIISAVIDSFKSVAAVDFFVGLSQIENSKLLTACAGLMGSAVKVFLDLKNKGKFVPELDFEILLNLKKRPEGVEIEYLFYLLSAKHSITMAELNERIVALENCYMTDGSKRSLLVRDGGVIKSAGV